MTPAEQKAYDTALRRIQECRRKGGMVLELMNLGLTVLPPEIGQLSALTKLRLSRNNLSMLPPEIGQLSALTELDLSNNKLSTLPSEIGQLSALMELNILKNQLSTLPPEIGQLTALTELDLQTNRLASVPPEIGQLLHLKSLLLNNNKLTALPPEIKRLSLLDQLYVWNNQLDCLPREIGDLSRISALYLSQNRLRSLPKELEGLKFLSRLLLHDNPALEIPDSILGPTAVEVLDPKRANPANPADILRYYFSRQKQGKAPMQELRLLMVGRGRVGKTSLVKALMGERPDEKEPETPGITVKKMALKCPQGEALAHVWDFGGQEFLHGTHQIFLSERCLYVLVLQGRESNWETETDYWIRFIQSFGGDSPVVVVLNKQGEHPFTVDTFRLQERCPQIVGFVSTDALSGVGVEELRALLEETVGEMKDVWLGVARNWHRVKQALERMPDKFLDYPRYQQVCAENKVTDEAEQASLAVTLHKLGIALNFRDHQRLRLTSVLKPEWVTEAIYGLIRFTQAKPCHGVFQEDWLRQALNAKDYPAEKYPFVLELMEKFEVAFALNGQTWLIPELLGEAQPQAFAEFQAAGVRRMRFDYPEALPPGILPRFIVRTHEMSEAHPDWRWRSGVVLEWGDCRALVRLFRTERRVEIAVIQCSSEAQQDLFDLIRSHLRVLHGKVRALETVELTEQPGTWVDTERLRLLEGRRAQSEEVTKDGQLTTVPVKETLDAISSQESRDAQKPDAPAPKRLFVSYAHSDAKALKPLSQHLTILGNRGYIQTWQDTQLIAGEQWKDRILEELAQAEIVLLIYSTHSRASKFIQETEAPEAVKMTKAKGKAFKLIVVPLDRKDWDKSVELEKELSAFQTATWNAVPVKEFKPIAKGWAAVEHAIRQAVVDMRKAV